MTAGPPSTPVRPQRDPGSAPQRVLVTGAAGGLGRTVLDMYVARGVAVTALDVSRSGLPECDRVVVGDASDPATVGEALDGVDAVVHLAAMASPNHGSPEVVFSNNVRSTFVVLEEAGRAGVRRAAVASSFSVLGLPWAGRPLHPAYLPVDEATPLQVEDPYALSKQVDEATAAMMARRHGMAVVALRFPFLGGHERLAARAADYAEDAAGGAAELWSYLDSRDAATACAQAVEAPLTGCHTVFLAAPDTLAPQPTEDLLTRYHPNVPRRRRLDGRSVPIDLAAGQRLLGFTARHVHPVATPAATG
jgi:nucleoside-diphosphate-sugar epimerase